MRKVLIVSPHFPPINAPDLQRVRMSLPYYRQFGWEPIVVMVAPEWQDASREEELLVTVPDDVRVVRLPALSKTWTSWLGVGNIGLRAWLHLRALGAEIIAREHIDLVFLSNAQFITFPLGRVWAESLGVPFVIDLQDPWRTDYYERAGVRRPPGGWKYQFARAQAWAFEEWTYRQMAALISVSENYLQELRERYPWFVRTPQRVIRFGASEVDLAHAAPKRRVGMPGPGQRIHFVYTGAAGPIMPHALTVLFNGLSRYQEINPEGARCFHFSFIGTSYAAPGKGVPSVMPVAEACGVAEQVDEQPHRIGHLECIRIQAEADVLLLLGSSDLAYSPSKLYPYYLAGRPMLSLVFYDSTLERLLAELNCSWMVRFQEHQPKDDAYRELHAFFDAALHGFPPGTLPERNERLFNQRYLARTLTGEQCAVFNEAVARQPAATVI